MGVYQHESFIPLEANSILWRYLDLEKFKSLLETRALFYCRADKFSDPFEGSIPIKEAEYRLKSEKIASELLGSEFNEEQAIKNIQGT